MRCAYARNIGHDTVEDEGRAWRDAPFTFETFGCTATAGQVGGEHREDRRVIGEILARSALGDVVWCCFRSRLLSNVTERKDLLGGVVEEWIVRRDDLRHRCRCGG